MTALKDAIPLAQQDPYRPCYHFSAPARSMGDPHGPIFFDDFYHLFYQFSPINDEHDCSYWGHARSNDLLHWEHLPIAIGPSQGSGEARCFSGCPLITSDGQAQLLYTSIGPGYRTHWHTAEQWLVEGDRDLIRWKKHAHNPVMPETIHGDTKVYDWRDPYGFVHQGETYVVCGGNLNQRAGGQAVVTLYRATNPQNTQWQYLGIVFVHPNKDVQNIECPNLFQLDDKWVLIVSPHSRPEYFIGSFDPSIPAFKAESHGLIECGSNDNVMFGTHSYAPYSFENHKGGRMLWTWVYGTAEVPGWNDCLSLPRELFLNNTGDLCQQPAAVLQSLRRESVSLPSLSMNAATKRIDGFASDTFEFICTIELITAQKAGLILRRQKDEESDLSFAFNRATVIFDHSTVALDRDSSTVKLHAFFDHSVVEIFIDNGRQCITKVAGPGFQNKDICLYSRDGLAQFRDVQFWHLATDGLFSFASEF